MAFTKLEDGYMNMYLNTIYQTDDSQPQDTMLASAPTTEPTGQVTVSGFKPQQVRTDVQPELGVARPIPQNKAVKMVEDILTKKKTDDKEISKKENSGVSKILLKNLKAIKKIAEKEGISVSQLIKVLKTDE